MGNPAHFLGTDYLRVRNMKRSHISCMMTHSAVTSGSRNTNSILLKKSRVTNASDFSVSYRWMKEVLGRNPMNVKNTEKHPLLPQACRVM